MISPVKHPTAAVAFLKGLIGKAENHFHGKVGILAPYVPDNYRNCIRESETTIVKSCLHLVSRVEKKTTYTIQGSHDLLQALTTGYLLFMGTFKMYSQQL